MESEFDIVTIANAVCVAVYVAITLCYLALYDFGMSREEVRFVSMVAAILIASMVAVDFFGQRPGKAK